MLIVWLVLILEALLMAASSESFVFSSDSLLRPCQPFRSLYRSGIVTIPSTAGHQQLTSRSWGPPCPSGNFLSVRGAKRAGSANGESISSKTTAKDDDALSSKQDDTTDDDSPQNNTPDPTFVRRNQYWVVLVDDEEPIRAAVGDFLYDAGYQVSACADAMALLEISRNPRVEGELPRVPDAIVSDIRMEGTDGIQLLAMIRADERLKRVPVILLTAKAMTKDRIEGFRTGADAYISKPFDPEELLAILDNRILRRRQMKGSEGGRLLDLKQQMADIKELMKRNGAMVVKKTDVYLTVAERQVLELICRGYTNSEIAKERGIGVPRVTTTIQKLYQETKTKSRTELVRWAIQTGYVPPR